MPFDAAPEVLLSGIAFGEQPRWHDGRLWFSDWGPGDVLARQGLMRAWVAILEQRHPEVTWIPAIAPGGSEKSTNGSPKELPEAA